MKGQTIRNTSLYNALQYDSSTHSNLNIKHFNRNVIVHVYLINNTPEIHTNLLSGEVLLNSGTRQGSTHFSHYVLL